MGKSLCSVLIVAIPFTFRDSGEFLDLLLHTWPTHTLERHIAVLQEAIKKGLADADAEARVHSRRYV